MTRKQLLTIKKYAIRQMSQTQDKPHDMDHIEQVRKNALRIIKVLDIESKIDKNLLQAICYLHDLTFADHVSRLWIYILEGLIIKRKIRQVFIQIKVNETEKKMITEAVVRHPYSFPLKRLNKNRGLYAQILQDADTLETLSDSRNKATLATIKKTYSLKIISDVLNLLFIHGKKNLKKYLNFPQLAEVF